MKKRLTMLFILLLSLGLLMGCTSGIAITIKPTTMVFTSGDDLIDGTIDIAVTGMGSLNIDSLAMQVIREDEAGNSTVFFSFDSSDPDLGIAGSFPINVPFAMQGISKSFDFQDDLLGAGDADGYTINDMLSSVASDYTGITYEDLIGETLTLKVVITGSANSEAEAQLVFN